MRILKQILNFYINSSFHVALSAYALAWITLLEFELVYDENVLYFVFFATITGYNFVKYFGVAKFHYRGLTTGLKAIQIVSLVSFVGLVFYVLRLQTHTLFYALLFGFVTFFYAIPFLPKRFFLDRYSNLRAIAGLKIYLIALVWTGATVALPLINNGFDLNDNLLITAAQRYVFIIVLMLPFEIRDLQYDSLKLSTVPQKIGVKQTKILGGLLLILFLFIEFFKAHFLLNRVIVLMLVGIFTLLLLVFSKVAQSRYYSGFWVEGLPLFWLVLLIVLKRF